MSLKARVLLLILAAACAGSAAGDEPLPPPTPVPAGPGVIILNAPSPPVPYRVSQYEVWQHLAPDRFGRFRPRVIYTPQGAYYSASGLPYPWLTVHPRNWMPYASE